MTVEHTPTHLIAIRTDLMRAAGAETRRARRSRRRLRLGGLALVAAAGLAAVAILLPSGGGDTAAAAALRRAAINAAGQPTLGVPGPGHFYHFTDTEMGWMARMHPAGTAIGSESCMTSCGPPPRNWTVRARITSEMFIGADGSAVRTTTVGRVVYRNAQVKHDLSAGLYPGSTPRHPFPTHLEYFPPGRTSGWSFGGMSLSQVRALPRDPDRLEAIVRARAEGTSVPLHAEMFVVVGDIMRAAPLSPQVAAAFYTVLSRLPGITLVGRVTDPLGRPGLEVRSAGQFLIFDPHTGQLLSEGDGGYSRWTIVGHRPHVSQSVMDAATTKTG